MGGNDTYLIGQLIEVLRDNTASSTLLISKVDSNCEDTQRLTASVEKLTASVGALVLNATINRRVEEIAVKRQNATQKFIAKAASKVWQAANMPVVIVLVLAAIATGRYFFGVNITDETINQVATTVVTSGLGG